MFLWKEYRLLSDTTFLKKIATETLINTRLTIPIAATGKVAAGKARPIRAAGSNAVPAMPGSRSFAPVIH